MFKLLSVKNDIYVSSPALDKNKENENPDENYYTLITGENGCGKSSLLSKAVNSYLFERNTNTVQVKETFDSQMVPSRVIAICNSAYNRFVSKRIYFNSTAITQPNYYMLNDVETEPRRALQSIISPAIKEVLAKYHFTKVNDDFNQKIINNLPYRNSNQVEDVTSAFHMIGIEPCLSMDLEFNKSYIQFFLRKQGRSIYDDLYLNTMEKVYFKEHIDFLKAMEISDESIDEFLSIYPELIKIKQLPRLTLRIDTLDFDFPSTKIHFDFLILAIRCGFITPNRIQVQRNSSLKWVSIQSLSSGQQSLLVSALLVSIFASPNSLICIDEPENSLHPEWQLDYMKFIAKLCPSNLGCHFLIATHSPQIISGMKTTNGCVVSLSAGQKKMHSPEINQEIENNDFISNNQELYELSHHIRKSADRQLIDIFKTPGFHNEPLVHRLVLILTKVTKKIAISSEDLNFINEVSSYIQYGKIDEYDAVNIILEQIKSMYVLR